MPLSPRDTVLVKSIVESLDDDGYLRTDLEELIAVTGLTPAVDMDELLFALRLVQSLWMGAVVVLGWLIGMIVFSYLMSVASQIFRCALFLYATQGTLPNPYNEGMMSLAWKTKKA